MSKAVFTSPEIGSFKINYTITMYGKNQVWVGTASKSIHFDIMPPAMPVAEGRVEMSPSKQIEIGKTLRFTAYIPNEGPLTDHKRARIYQPHSPSVDLQNLNVKKKGRQYVITGEFTPKEAGKHSAFFSFPMIDKRGLPVEGLAELEFEVVESSKISVFLSPDIAHTRVGEDIYLLLTYQLREGAKH